MGQAAPPLQELPNFSIGVGIHSGRCCCATSATPGRGELTVVGDSVNIAARLEDQNKELGWAVVASEATVNAAGSAVVVGSRRTISCADAAPPLRRSKSSALRPAISDDCSGADPRGHARGAAATPASPATRKGRPRHHLSIMTGEFGESA